MLDKFKDNTNVDLKEYKKAGLIDTEKAIIKILGNGELKKKLEVHAHRFSKSAKEKIEKLGGKAILIEVDNKIDKKSKNEIKEENKEVKVEDKEDSDKK
jgi:large subunit ribosomal protein L15